MVTIIGANWCTPCQTLKRALELLKVPYEYADVDEQPERAEALEISSLPTILFKDGARFEGCPPIRVLNMMLVEHGETIEGGFTK